MTDDMARMDEFSRELSSVINRFSMESPSGTQYFILGDLLTSVLASYNDAVQKRAEWRGEKVELSFVQPIVDKLALPQPIQEDLERSKSHFQKVLDGITDEQISYRQQYIEYLMANPGFIATFGEDFVVEYGTMDLSTDPKPEYNQLNEYRVTFSQEVRFYRREVWDAMRSANKTGLAEEVRDLQDRLRVAREQGDDAIANALIDELSKRADDLKDLGLRLDPNGNLESI